MTYNAKIVWKKADSDAFIDNKYSRGHRWIFDGLEVVGSSSPHVVPEPLSLADAVDPEEAFVASLSSCHMLWFLSLAAGKGVVVISYEDNAEGTLSKNEEGRMAMTRVVLRPQIDSDATDEEVLDLHRLAHEKCFLANSVKTLVEVESVS